MRVIAVGAALLGCALGLIGCVTPAMQEDAARVQVLEPRPLVDLPDSTKGMKLEIDASVGDRFTIAERDGITAVPVEGWHSSLQNGFTNGPGRFFKGNAAEADALKLTILNAELDYVPTAVFTRGVNVVGAAAVQARLRYVARLVDSKGDVLARDQGEVFSTSQWTGPGGSSTTASEAIAAMYQNISRQIVAAVE
jgi:hypothetical protein